jgi:hypothetical protein
MGAFGRALVGQVQLETQAKPAIDLFHHNIDGRSKCEHLESVHRFDHNGRIQLDKRFQQENVSIQIEQDISTVQVGQFDRSTGEILSFSNSKHVT